MFSWNKRRVKAAPHTGETGIQIRSLSTYAYHSNSCGQFSSTNLPFSNFLCIACPYRCSRGWGVNVRSTWAGHLCASCMRMWGRVIDSGRASWQWSCLQRVVWMTCGRCGSHCQLYPLLISPEPPPVCLGGWSGARRIHTSTSPEVAG
ncbi:hypothetical protein LOAG_00121 [Loa loa]|uniref:Uncharacterized protein n=1 Tax=Loa loa TaxID=7209 RepID=A0A1S0UCN6_LOALO|nr:hypothetical protein LOAG_00121 [Loa loa]EFO28344.1 hypothetical protein LOAG_00121 [Loa loa]